jgi:hypothetical protein
MVYTRHAASLALFPLSTHATYKFSHHLCRTTDTTDTIPLIEFIQTSGTRYMAYFVHAAWQPQSAR